eukprot:PhF_6_TR27185/c0_g1_i3/m.39912
MAIVIPRLPLGGMNGTNTTSTSQNPQQPQHHPFPLTPHSSTNKYFRSVGKVHRPQFFLARRAQTADAIAGQPGMSSSTSTPRLTPAPPGTTGPSSTKFSHVRIGEGTIGPNRPPPSTPQNTTTFPRIQKGATTTAGALTSRRTVSPSSTLMAITTPRSTAPATAREYKMHVDGVVYYDDAYRNMTKEELLESIDRFELNRDTQLRTAPSKKVLKDTADKKGEQSILQVLFQLKLGQRSGVFKELSTYSPQQLDLRLRSLRSVFQGSQMDRDELRFILAELLHRQVHDVDAKEASTLFDLFDHNKSGSVDYDEFVEGIGLLLEANTNTAMFRWVANILEKPFPSKLISHFEVSLLATAVLNHFQNVKEAVTLIETKLWPNLHFWSDSQLPASAFRKVVLDDPDLRRLFHALPRPNKPGTDSSSSMKRTTGPNGSNSTLLFQAASSYIDTNPALEETRMKETIRNLVTRRSSKDNNNINQFLESSLRKDDTGSTDLIGTTSSQEMPPLALKNLPRQVSVVMGGHHSNNNKSAGPPQPRMHIPQRSPSPNSSQSVVVAAVPNSPVPQKSIEPTPLHKNNPHGRGGGRGGGGAPDDSLPFLERDCVDVKDPRFKCDQFRDTNWSRQIGVGEHGNPQYYVSGDTVWCKLEGEAVPHLV